MKIKKTTIKNINSVNKDISNIELWKVRMNGKKISGLSYVKEERVYKALVNRFENM